MISSLLLSPSFPSWTDNTYKWLKGMCILIDLFSVKLVIMDFFLYLLSQIILDVDCCWLVILCVVKIEATSRIQGVSEHVGRVLLFLVVKDGVHVGFNSWRRHQWVFAKWIHLGFTVVVDINGLDVFYWFREPSEDTFFSFAFNDSRYNRLKCLSHFDSAIFHVSDVLELFKDILQPFNTVILLS